MDLNFFSPFVSPLLIHIQGRGGLHCTSRVLCSASALHPATARATAPLPDPPTSQPPPKHSPAAPLRVSRCLPRASVKPPREPLWEATQYPCPQVLRAPRPRGKEPARPTLLPRGLGGEPRSTCPLLPRPRERVGGAHEVADTSTSFSSFPSLSALSLLMVRSLLKVAHRLLALLTGSALLREREGAQAEAELPSFPALPPSRPTAWPRSAIEGLLSAKPPRPGDLPTRAKTQ